MTQSILHIDENRQVAEARQDEFADRFPETEFNMVGNFAQAQQFLASATVVITEIQFLNELQAHFSAAGHAEKTPQIIVSDTLEPDIWRQQAKHTQKDIPYNEKGSSPDELVALVQSALEVNLPSRP